ncbi:MFS transporter [Streptomyces sp. SCSIO 30461]|uniref:MFS transporter n=1 Tax=Streptomyces sp. SCSIO 30461 TaxID=3118085 RepID=UPI0030CE52F9
MTPYLDPRTARRRFTVVTFLFWLPVGLYLPALVLLPTERGFSVAAIAGLFAVYSLTVAALELPTGGLSDVIGRRPVLVAAGVLNLAALVLFAVGTTAWVLTLAMLLLGAGRALSSGPAEAWYVDTVQAHSGWDAELRTGLARAGTASATALAAGTLIGGALPWLLGLGPDPGAWLAEATSGVVLPLSAPGLLGGAVVIAFMGFVLTRLPEPPRPPATLRGVVAGVPATVIGGLRLGARDRLVRRLLLTACATGAALGTIELLMPGRASALTGAPESGAAVFAGLACGGFACTAVGSHLAPFLARVAGDADRAVFAGLGAMATGLLVLTVSVACSGVRALVLLVVGYALVYLALGAAGPNENELLHGRVSGAHRATALSVQSLALQALGAVIGLLAAALPQGPFRWLPGALLLVAGALLWVRRDRGDGVGAAGGGDGSGYRRDRAESPHADAAASTTRAGAGA